MNNANEVCKIAKNAFQPCLGLKGIWKTDPESQEIWLVANLASQQKKLGTTDAQPGSWILKHFNCLSSSLQSHLKLFYDMDCRALEVQK